MTLLKTLTSFLIYVSFIELNKIVPNKEDVVERN